LIVEVVVTTNVARLSGSNFLFFKRRQNCAFNSFTTERIDGMSDVGKHPISTSGGGRSGTCVWLRIYRKRHSAMGTIAGFYVVLRGATDAFFHQLSAWHGHEMPTLALDDLQIPDDEFRVECDGAERSQAIINI